ncbi:hypothetical protein SPONL_1297 [uncultured Candidatus Thioglobus sp.]|nr:hypothetical protein SPONL_1297 [uncultured Candidatus Thioglobus sp.]
MTVENQNTRTKIRTNKTSHHTIISDCGSTHFQVTVQALVNELDVS